MKNGLTIGLAAGSRRFRIVVAVMQSPAADPHPFPLSVEVIDREGGWRPCSTSGGAWRPRAATRS